MKLLAIGAGSNVGNRRQYITNSLALCQQHFEQFVATSALYQTPPWGITQQQDFFNQIWLFKTKLSATMVLDFLQQVENQLGRQRQIKWGPRCIDLDILFMAADIINLPNLVVPHPFMQHRRFVLQPLAQVAPSWQHPLSGLNTVELLNQCADASEIKPLS